MSCTYAHDTRLGRPVALKALPMGFSSDARRRERLTREATAAAQLTHPGIATVYALEEVEGQLFIASEYIAGETLRERLARGPLSPSEVSTSRSASRDPSPPRTPAGSFTGT